MRITQLRNATLIVHIGRVPVIDATGFVALENTLRLLRSRGKRVVLAGPLPKPSQIWESAAKEGHLEGVHIVNSLADAVALVNESVAEPAQAIAS